MPPIWLPFVFPTYSPLTSLSLVLCNPSDLLFGLIYHAFPNTREDFAVEKGRGVCSPSFAISVYTCHYVLVGDVWSRVSRSFQCGLEWTGCKKVLIPLVSLCRRIRGNWPDVFQNKERRRRRRKNKNKNKNKKKNRAVAAEATTTISTTSITNTSTSTTTTTTTTAKRGREGRYQVMFWKESRKWMHETSHMGGN